MVTRRKSATKVEGESAALPATTARRAGRHEALANVALSASINAAVVVSAYANPFKVEHNANADDIGALMDRLTKDVGGVWAGDMKGAEAMLFAQAHALQSIFANLARRACRQEYMKHWEAYLRMALKAQNQCRMTLESLATIKNPPLVVARQANISHGPQLVNNAAGPGADTHAAQLKGAETELLEDGDGKRLDTGAAGTAGGADPRVEALGAVHRAVHR